MDDRAHNQYQGFADYLVFGKMELKIKEETANGKLLHVLSVAKMEGRYFQVKNSSLNLLIQE